MMKLSGKKILIFAVVVLLLVIWLWPKRSLKINSVEDGCTIVLNNGATVKLLGIVSSYEGQDVLEQLIGEKVVLVSDKDKPFEESRLDKSSVIYAYVLLPSHDYDCINSSLLKDGKAALAENCVDSLRLFQQYANSGKPGNRKEPTPTPAPVIDYNEDDIQLPDYKQKDERKHSVWYVDGNMNLQMLDEACDYDLPYTKCFANQLAARSAGNFNPGQICEIFDYCYKKWRYVNDPKGHEYVARASETIANSLTGDCDDFAVLMASCLLAVGADVCINSGQNPTGAHAFTEVDISQFNEYDVLDVICEHFPNYKISEINTRNANGKKWLNLDWQASYPGGPYFDCSSRWDAYPCIDGNWKWNKIR